MQAILVVTLPFFALILCGYLAAQRGLLAQAAIPGLNGFVLFFALPCLLFRFGLNTSLAVMLSPAVLAVYVPAALIMVALTIRLTRSERVPMKDAAFGALVAAFPNTGFMGVPLLVALLGAAAAGPVICTILVDLLLTSSLCIALASGNTSGNTSGKANDKTVGQTDGHDAAPAAPQTALLQALRGALSNPLPWSIALGLGVAGLGLSLPGPLMTVVNMLGDAASPVALFTIGAVLWRAGQHAHSRTPVRLYLPVALLKLLLHPSLVFGLGSLVQALGAPLSGFQLTVLTLAAALPSASNVSLLAERYGADNGRVARIIMASTVLAFASFSALAWWLMAAGQTAPV
ncbi:AEC family transporter [Roseateles albus]|uniref:AEC family transporter n=1 Tax=Roseateles albus TaxID=2987525 RepID=A0ABT5KBU7_9BURK|nr:AEC family transporter [Roseateles albus]MDC8771417.1 AEC family transporter [Roseateles albus]